MTHKVHPKAFRMRKTEDFTVRGFYGRHMTAYLEEDYRIRAFLEKTFADALISRIEVDHSAGRLTVTIETARPGLIIGRGGQGAEQMKTAIGKILDKLAKGESDLKKPAREVKVDIREIKNPWTQASLVAKMAAQQIERRMPFRQVIKRSMERVMQNREVKGVKMEMSGRLNGIEIARKEWLKQGRMPLATMRADIDYAQTEAHCTYGSIGIKVWIYKGDKFE